jgi:hypothetical protein
MQTIGPVSQIFLRQLLTRNIVSLRVLSLYNLVLHLQIWSGANMRVKSLMGHWVYSYLNKGESDSM